MTSFGPDFGKLYPADKTTPNPGIHNQDGPTGTTNPGSLPATSDQTQQVARTISGGVMRDVAVAVGNVVTNVGDIFEDAFTALSNWGADVIGGFAAIFNGWFGGGGTGSPAEVTYVIETIKDAVINGYNVVTFTSDAVAWPVPAHAEMHIAAIGGGQNGGVGGGVGGLHGSFLSSLVDMTGIASLDIQVATAGNRTYVREAAGTAHTGTVIVQSPIHGSDGGITNSLGQLTKTTSLPGNGGNGGNAIPTTAGQSTPMAAGGTAGAAGPSGSSGGPGGSVSVGAQIKCGGAGGGGGGGANGFLGAGGDGGAGGYPGGAGGTSGGGWSGGPHGAAGPGAPGVAWIYYR